MSESDVKVYRVYDDAVFPTQAAFACNVGATSVSSIRNTAVSSNSSQNTFNIITPSEKVYLDRKPLWRSDCYLQFVWTPNTANLNFPVVVPGADIALAPYPLHQLTSTMQASINDEVVTINTSDVLNELLRIAEYNDQKHSTVRKCPYYLDTYASYNKAVGTNLNPLAGYNSSTVRDYIGNGAFGELSFTDQDGNVLAGTNSYTVGATTVNYVNGIPVQAGTIPAGGYPIYIKFTSCEELVLSPFIWSDIKQSELGIYGVKNLTFIFTQQPPAVNRVIRTQSTNGVLTALNYNLTASVGGGNSAFGNAQILTKYYTPPLSLPEPKMNMVPYMNYPRYLTQQAPAPTAPGTTAVLASQTLSIDQIPDLIFVYVKPQTYAATDATWYYPITNIQVNWNNQQSLMSSFTQEQLFELNVRNGIDIDYNQYLGNTWVVPSPLSTSSPNNMYVQLSGAPLVIRPGYDFFLGSEALTSNMMGNYSLQINVTVLNTTNITQPSTGTNGNFNLYIMCVNSGMFVTQGGSSKVIRSLVKPDDVVNAELAPVATRDAIARVVGQGLKARLIHGLSHMHKHMPHMHGHSKFLHMHAHHGMGEGEGLAGAGLAGAKRRAHSRGSRRSRRSRHSRHSHRSVASMASVEPMAMGNARRRSKHSHKGGRRVVRRLR